MTVPEDVLLEEVSALGKLHVCLGAWESGERAGEHEASLTVSGREFAEVLRRLAVSSAELFVERYHKPVDEGDTDWDKLEYLKDFRAALEFCGLAWGDAGNAGKLKRPGVRGGHFSPAKTGQEIVGLLPGSRSLFRLNLDVHPGALCNGIKYG